MQTSVLYRHANRMARLAFLRAFEGGAMIAEVDPGLSLPGSVRGVMADLVHETEAQAIFYASVEALVATKVNAVLAEKGEGPFFCSEAAVPAHTAPGVESVSPRRGTQAPPVERKRAKKGRAA